MNKWEELVQQLHDAKVEVASTQFKLYRYGSTCSPVVMSFGTFRDKSALDARLDNASIYVVLDGERVKYIGMTRRHVYNRWFEGSRGHMARNAGGYWFGNSPIGRAIVDGAPHSDNWTCEFWTVKDASIALGCYPDIEDVERTMIWVRRPELNGTYNA